MFDKKKLIKKLQSKLINNLITYSVLFIVALFCIATSTYFDTLKNFNELEFQTYWVFSFFGMFFEVVLVSILITSIIEILKEVADEEKLNNISWKNDIFKTVDDMKNKVDKLEEDSLESADRKLYKSIKEIKEMILTFEGKIPLKSKRSVNRKMKKLQKKFSVLLIENIR